MNTQLTEEQKQIVETIRFIHDVDFVPEPREAYEALPEPYRSMALEALDYRTKYWDDLVADRKKQFE